MQPRRRMVSVSGDSTKAPLLKDQSLDEYDKLDKKRDQSIISSFLTRPTSYKSNNWQPSPPADEPSKLNDFDFLLEKGEEVWIMAARDRTNEFAAAIRSLQGRTLVRPTVKDPRKVAALETYSQFMGIAKVISRNISSTYAKLEKLAMLAKKKSLFDDRPTEIQELTYIIKGDLSSLNQQIARLGEMPRGKRSMHSHSSSVVLALQSRLATMSSQFKQVLEVRSENLKYQNSRKEQLISRTPVPIDPPPAILLPQDEVSIDLGEDMGLLTQTQQLALRDDTDTYVQQRAETMQNIESTIVELGGIFQQLAHMVKEQDEAIGRIDANISDAEMNVEAGHREILKYFQSISGNRALMLKIFGVLIFFFIFFVVVMA